MQHSFIETYSGIAFHPLSPSGCDIRITDIAHSLAHQCRFSGHTRQHYSVAEHSVRVSDLLERSDASPSVVLWGLLHDASEAYLADIPAPLKKSPLFRGYRAAEKHLMGIICERFGLVKDEPQAVKRVDLILLATEARDLMPYRPEHWGALTELPLLDRIDPWSAKEAEKRFLTRFAQLYRSGT